jgi:hypothetical protein
MGGSENLDAAASLYDHVIEVDMAALGADHRETAAALHNKARALAKLGGVAHLQEAVTLYDRVIQIRTATLGADHAETVAALHNKAVAQAKMDEAGQLEVAPDNHVSDTTTAALEPERLEATATLPVAASSLTTSREAAAPTQNHETTPGRHNKPGMLSEMVTASTASDAASPTSARVEAGMAPVAADRPEAAAQHGATRALSTDVETLTPSSTAAVEARTSPSGVDHTETATALYDLAYALAEAGGAANMQEAVALYDRSIEMQTAAIGGG